MATPVQLGLRTVYLPSGDIVNTSNDCRNEFTLSELKLFLFLLIKANTFPHSYFPSWYLARSVFPDKYHRHRDHAIHAVEEHLSGMRKKLGERPYHPQYLIGSRDKGYRLYLPKRCASVTVEKLRSLFDKLKSR